MTDKPSGNVFSLRSGKLLSEEIKAAEEEEEKLARHDKEVQLKTLDAVRSLIEEGKLSSFLLIGRSPNGVFLTEVCFNSVEHGETILSYIGAIECLRLELTDIGQGLPQMLNDGSIVALHTDELE